ncbi:hypothetical protein FE391_38600 [Nonomuraea sp. KC401]|uniref:hypothetical protein n=1 Tax=unclassified Nonomuraea TaxID=2593643 RepID=UPI0010FDF1C0|nr:MULTISPECIES: hypothetical protein [unclassified Nonomuraea]NBE98089.1 hypothetical protein [Nonomuraea sp. K271]TLF56865.1 hypothetical protein FE391_38600 [Nonomuraea sp. KC401]
MTSGHEPPEPDPSVYWTPPPRTVTIASAVWICFGALVAPAIMLQFMPDSNGWFRKVNQG